MVLDDLLYAFSYDGLGPGIARALRYLQHTDLGLIAPGRHEIGGPGIFALVSDYDTKPRAEGVWEAHRRHLDIQYVHAGEERVGRALLADLAEGPYDQAKDVLFAEGEGDYFVLAPGRFAIFFPHDAHMPGLAIGAAARVRKIVIKVALD